MKLYSFSLSPPGNRVRVTLYELGVDFEFVPVNVLAGEGRDPEFVKKQPFGQIPYLEDGEVALFESRAIMRYLAETHGTEEHCLYGKTAKEKAAVDQWMDVESFNYGIPVQKLISNSEIYVTRIRPGSKIDPAVKEENTDKLEKVLDIYDAHLAKNKYLAGDFFSLADLTHLPFTHLLLWVSNDALELFKRRKHVFAWWTDISSRPSWQQVMAAAAPTFQALTGDNHQS